jgi:integrase
VADDDRLAAMWWLLLENGPRPGEVFAVRWSDLKGHVLHIRRALIRMKDGTYSFGATKTHAARELRLSAELVAALKSHKARQNAERLQAGRHYHTDLDLIFATELGEPLRHDVVTRMYKRLVKQAKAPALHLYGLRHTSASLKDEAGVSARTIAEGLGHKDPTITQKFYVRSGVAQQEAATVAMSALLAAAAPKTRKA